MAEGQGTRQWQVTCQCGWRVHGTKDVIVPAVQEHGRSALGIELSEEQVMAQAVAGPEAP
jgi:hypothetical protein